MLGILPTVPDTPDIRQYHALFTQTGTANPVVNVLHNTLGETLIWTRVNLGVYTATSSGIFTANKTIIIPFGGTDQSTRLVRTPTGAGTPFCAHNIRRDSITDVTLRQYTAVNTVTLKEYSDVPGESLIIIYIYK